MKVKKNKRTLKKRVRRIVFLCIFITILLFGSIIIYLFSALSNQEAKMVSEYFSSSIAQTMNSPLFLKQMGITGLENFDPNSPNGKEWIETLRISQNKPMEVLDSKNGNQSHQIIIKNDNGESTTLNINTIISTTIELKNNVVYMSDAPKTGILPNHPINNTKKNWLEEKFTGSDSVYALYDSHGNVIGHVITSVNGDAVTAVFIIFVTIVIFVGLLSLLISFIISRFLTKGITSPLAKLDEKIKALSQEDYDSSSVDKQIILKKPLREIESLADSTNLIMKKMSDFNSQLQSQKLTLEYQNEELEAQNEELIESKRKLEEAQTMLVQSENMASIGQLTAAITHEINTPLGAISSNIQLFDMLIASLSQHELVKSNDELAEYSVQMKEANDVNILASKRVVEIIKSLKTFTKLDQAEFQEASIPDGIKSVLILTSNLWKRKITMHEEYDAYPILKCFPGLLNQVFMNIIVNAIHAVADKGDIFIKTYSDEEYYNISIRDTGNGIKEEHLRRIFEPGFSTKAAGVGAGLGLSICSNIVNKHNGKLEVTSEVGKGTEFIIRIPSNL